MNARHYQLEGMPVTEFQAEDTPQLCSERDALDAIAAASPNRSELAIVPVQALSEDFFRLKTRVAGEIVQKFVTYHLRLVILGDISKHLSESSALRDFVYECNAGPHIWFVANIEELRRRLSPRQAS